MAPKRSDPSTLASFSRSALMDLAGPGAFARGMSYHSDGRVELQPGTRGRVRAQVRGTMPYEVELWEVTRRTGMVVLVPGRRGRRLLQALRCRRARAAR